MLRQMLPRLACLRSFGPSAGEVQQLFIALVASAVSQPGRLPRRRDDMHAKAIHAIQHAVDTRVLAVTNA